MAVAWTDAPPLVCAGWDGEAAITTAARRSMAQA
jgi:hypothetical protein